MKILRVYLEHAWRADEVLAWSLRDDRSGAASAGRSTSVEWPAHDALEIVLGAALVRLVALDLPPMPSSRLAAAARFALDDQIALDDAGTHVAIAPPRDDGGVIAILCPRAVMEPLHARHGALGRLERVVAEPELCAPEATWRWCAHSADGAGFVRTSDGASFATSAVDADRALPPELRIALAHARNASVPAVRVEWSASAEELARWEHATGVTFTAGVPWRWDQPGPETLTNLLQGDFARGERGTRPDAWRLFVPAATLLGVAALFHLLATFGTWIAIRVELWQAESTWSSLALAAGLPKDTLSSPPAIRNAIRQRHDDVLHARHRFTRSDALALLARTSGAIAALPPGTVKRAVYADAHWTFDLQGLQPAAAGDVQKRFLQADVDARVVRVEGGFRARVGSE